MAKNKKNADQKNRKPAQTGDLTAEQSSQVKGGVTAFKGELVGIEPTFRRK